MVDGFQLFYPLGGKTTIMIMNHQGTALFLCRPLAAVAWGRVLWMC